mmetsp:Transcript_9716/g.13078  ORF Transcript_9716/g.13078 Transcript_9716/m.13078 type:complete len:306 (+) Transcript_9716:136-1053(+)
MMLPDEDGSGGDKKQGMLEEGVWTRWDNTFQICKFLAETISQYDKDHIIPIIFFGNRALPVEVTGVNAMLREFLRHKPADESTNMIEALKNAFSYHLHPDENNLFIIITDGCPNPGQEKQVKDLIYEQATRADPNGEAINLLFIRIGDDPAAIQFLSSLDDCSLIGENVDTKSDNEAYSMGPKTLILNAIYEHLDDSLPPPVPSSAARNQSFLSTITLGSFGGSTGKVLAPRSIPSRSPRPSSLSSSNTRSPRPLLTSSGSNGSTGTVSKRKNPHKVRKEDEGSCLGIALIFIPILLMFFLLYYF